MIRRRLLELQWLQLNHDKRYHREIVSLTIGDRLKHMALHLAKYAGAIAEASGEGGRQKREQALVDTYIITLASANAVGLDLGRSLPNDAAAARSLRELGVHLASNSKTASGSDHTFLLELTIAVGRLAKACESLDHVESFPFKEGMQRALMTIFTLVVAEAAQEGVDLEARSEDRLDGIRSRHIFNNFFKEEMRQVRGRRELSA